MTDFDRRFSKQEFRAHLKEMGVILADSEFSTLLERTKKNTRGGQMFGFKPTTFVAGINADGRFRCGYSAECLQAGVNVQTGKELVISF